ncbi:MAG TPA: TlpA disulfide reductase family protein [Smithellaceae bacterium]|nr:TlpA disulfide reductase family protein [Smithellaceae bacterium]
MKKIYLTKFAAIIIFALSPVWPCAALERAPFIPYKSVRTPAPDFTLKDLQGRQFQLKSQRGKQVMIVFGATWCPYCRSEIPNYKAIYEKYTPQGIVFTYINIMESRDKVAGFSRANSLPYRTLIDEDGRVAQSFNVVGVPMIVIVDKEGRIVVTKNLVRQLDLPKLFSSQSR